MGGDGVPKSGIGFGAGSKTNVGEYAGNEGEVKFSAFEVLWGSKDACGDIATGNDGVLYAGDNNVDACGAEATPDSWIMGWVGSGQGPLKAGGFVTFEKNFLDREAGVSSRGNKEGAFPGTSCKRASVPRSSCSRNARSRSCWRSNS